MSNKQEKIKLGISRCLLGENVRYDGQHKLDTFLRDVLGAHVEYVSVCPEVEYGMTVPREPIHLEGHPQNPRLMSVLTHADLTKSMKKWTQVKTKQLAKENLCGFIFKSQSPSCGLQRVPVHNTGQTSRAVGRGMFAATFTDAFPLLPVEEESRLREPLVRENFLTRIFTMQRWRQVLATSLKPSALIEFHTAHKLLLLAHSPRHYRELGHLLADLKGNKSQLKIVADKYQKLLLEGLSRQATIPRQVNVLEHAAGYFKKQLDADSRQELQTLIENYRREIVPLIVPVTLLNHYVRKFGEDYLAKQVYLNPHPLELKLSLYV